MSFFETVHRMHGLVCARGGRASCSGGRLALARVGLLAFFAVALGVSLEARAHEIRPAYLEIREQSDQTVHVLWKQPAVGDLALALRPSLSSGWLTRESAVMSRTDSYLLLQWTIEPPHDALEGQRLTIEGLERTMTDVLVRTVFGNGVETTRLVKPREPTLVLSRTGRTSPPVADYLRLGVMHIWTGIDHLLYVAGLMLLVRRRSDLIRTITAFTVAHSLTLAAAALHFVNVPPAPIEAMIALSIVYVAVELVHSRQGRAGLASRFPWLIAFGFGLLHGFGFAGALAQVGLPPHDIPLALLFFNVGIEVGQLVFVAAVLLLARSALYLAPRATSLVARVTPHAIGSLAAFWFIDRTVQLF